MKVLLFLAILVSDVRFIIPKYNKQYFVYQYFRHAAPLLFKLQPFPWTMVGIVNIFLHILLVLKIGRSARNVRFTNRLLYITHSCCNNCVQKCTVWRFINCVERNFLPTLINWLKPEEYWVQFWTIQPLKDVVTLYRYGMVLKLMCAHYKPITFAAAKLFGRNGLFYFNYGHKPRLRERSEYTGSSVLRYMYKCCLSICDPIHA
jgi:hypothetical protein